MKVKRSWRCSKRCTGSVLLKCDLPGIDLYVMFVSQKIRLSCGTIPTATLSDRVTGGLQSNSPEITNLTGKGIF